MSLTSIRSSGLSIKSYGLSGYGFSFDDDVSDVGAGGASALTITYASGPAANPVQTQWFPSTPWGTVTAMATISPLRADRDMHAQVDTHDPTAGYKSFLAGIRERPEQWSGGSVRLDHSPGIVIPPKTILAMRLDGNALTFLLPKGAITPTTKPISVTFKAYV